MQSEGEETVKIGKKKIPSSIILVTILMFGVLVSGVAYINFIKVRYDKIFKRAMTQETEQVIEDIDKRMGDIFYYLEYFSKLVAGQDTFQCENGIEQLEQVIVGEKFNSLGIADTNGNACMLDGSKKDVSAEEYFQKSLNGEYVVTDTIIDNSNSTNIYSIPITQSKRILGVIFAENATGDVENNLIAESMDIENNLWIVNSDGQIMLNTTRNNQYNDDENIFNIFKSEKGNNGAASKLKDKIRKKQSGFISINLENTEKILYFKPVDINGWYVLTVMSKDKISEDKNEILSKTNFTVLAFTVIYAITLIFVVMLQNRNKQKIEHIAYVDELTGGISFTKFKEDVDKLLRNSSEQYALVDLDIDKFKYINDIFGYEEGNNVIRFIWNEIDNIMESGEVFAHYRADRFVLLLKSNDMDHVVKRMEMLSLTSAKRESCNEKNYEIILSIGIYPIDKRMFRIDTAMDRAELTKKSIKGKHRKIYAIYDEELRQKILKDQEIENMMEKALQNEEFKVYYQPKYNSSTSELTGAEALVRWYNEEIGMIFPNEFIPVFENNGFIVDLDEYMFEHVCRDVRKWLDEGCMVVPVSVNLSQLQLYNLRFIEEYKDILEKYDIPPEYIQLELTETTLFTEADILINIIDELHKIGFKILMDDFGTGYSSLNMLKNVPVDILKLDKSFVDDIGDSKGDIVVSTIVSLGQLLNMKIIAEGVETKEQYEFLRDIFCDEIQGYYFSRPISSEEYRNVMVKGAL